MLRSVRLFATPWTIASEAPLSMGLPRQQCKSRWLQKEPEDEGRCCSVDKSCLTLCSPWTAACQASLSLNISRSLPKFVSTESVMPPNTSSSDTLFSCAQSFPASGSSPMSQLFASGGQSIGASASASVFPTSIQG